MMFLKRKAQYFTFVQADWSIQCTVRKQNKKVPSRNSFGSFKITYQIIYSVHYFILALKSVAPSTQRHYLRLRSHSRQRRPKFDFPLFPPYIWPISNIFRPSPKKSDLFHFHMWYWITYVSKSFQEALAVWTVASHFLWLLRHWFETCVITLHQKKQQLWM